LLAIVVQAHGDLAAGGRKHHAGAADHDAGVGRATEGRERDQRGAKGEQVLHRKIPGWAVVGAKAKRRAAAGLATAARRSRAYW